MKKVALFLVLLMVTSSITPAVASERIDFSNFSLDELILLKTWISGEITERTKDDKVVYVPAGIYIVGMDIPCAAYTITGVTNKSYSVTVSVYNGNDERIYCEFLDNGEQIGKLELQVGQYVKIQDGAVEFSTYKGLEF